MEAVPDPVHDRRSRCSGRPSRPTCGSGSRARAACSRCVMAYRMASRLIGGRVYGAIAGVCAFAALLSSNKFVRDAALGNSEPMLGGDRPVGVRAPPRRPPRPRALPRRRRRAACAPRRGRSSALYGLWLWFTEPHLRKRLVVVRRAGAVGLVPARVVGLGRPASRRLARERPQPRQRRVRRHPGARPWRTASRRCTIAPVELGHDRRGRLRGRACGAATAREGETLALALGGFAWFAAWSRR